MGRKPTARRFSPSQFWCRVSRLYACVCEKQNERIPVLFIDDCLGFACFLQVSNVLGSPVHMCLHTRAYAAVCVSLRYGCAVDDVTIFATGRQAAKELPALIPPSLKTELTHTSGEFSSVLAGGDSESRPASSVCPRLYSRRHACWFPVVPARWELGAELHDPRAAAPRLPQDCRRPPLGI